MILLLLTADGCPFVTACEAVKVAGDKVLNSNTMAGGAGGRQYMTLRKKAEKKKDILARTAHLYIIRPMGHLMTGRDTQQRHSRDTAGRQCTGQTKSTIANPFAVRCRSCIVQSLFVIICARWTEREDGEREREREREKTRVCMCECVYKANQRGS